MVENIRRLSSIWSNSFTRRISVLINRTKMVKIVELLIFGLEKLVSYINRLDLWSILAWNWRDLNGNRIWFGCSYVWYVTYGQSLISDKNLILVYRM